MTNFDISNKPQYDSIIKANDSLIRNANTLIVDIRNNTGGRIRNYFELFKYIYTQPIVHCGVYVKYSKAYANDLSKQGKEYGQKGDTANARLYQAWADTVNANAGKEEFDEADTLAQNLTVLPSPKNIALITNNLCLSAAELMVLNFRQSSKVTTFGETTGGAVDYLVTIDDLPIVAGKYSLFIAISKRALTKRDPSYDGVGIKPDVEIGDEVSDWVDFVRKYYARKQ
jgi:C-terminal processing protease CtpA/Prc